MTDMQTPSGRSTWNSNENSTRSSTFLTLTTNVGAFGVESFVVEIVELSVTIKGKVEWIITFEVPRFPSNTFVASAMHDKSEVLPMDRHADLNMPESLLKRNTKRASFLLTKALHKPTIRIKLMIFMVEYPIETDDIVINIENCWCDRQLRQ